MRIAIRVPNLDVYTALKPYQDGTQGKIPFVFYAGIDPVEELVAAGAASGDNPAELGVLIGCNENTLERVNQELPRYIRANVTYLMQDCEKGPDDLWGLPDVPALAEQLAPIVHASDHPFRWQIAMQYGYLENTYGPGGSDASVCSGRQRSTCDLAASYAALAWKHYAAGDVMMMFGESGRQQTAADFEDTNRDWIDFIVREYPQNEWWGASGLVDKNRDGQVDLEPQAMYEIALRAEALGASGFGIIWLGRSSASLLGPETRMGEFLDRWAAHVAQSPSPIDTPAPIPSPAATSAAVVTPTSAPAPGTTPGPTAAPSATPVISSQVVPQPSPSPIPDIELDNNGVAILTVVAIAIGAIGAVVIVVRRRREKPRSRRV